MSPNVRREGSQRRRFLPWYAVVVTLTVCSVLNVIPRQRGSLVFQDEFYTEAFEASRGWPLKSWARCNEAGVGFIRASVVQGDCKSVPDVFPDSEYPHLAYDGFAILADGVVACLLAWIAFAATSRFQGQRFIADEQTVSQSASE